MMAGLGALGALMVLFGETPSWLGGEQYELRIRVREKLSGIDEGVPILLSGIKIGRVTKLEFIDAAKPLEGVYIFGSVKEEFTIPAGVIATCVGPVLGLGRGHIELQAPLVDQGPLPDGIPVDGVMGNALGEVFPETMTQSLEDTVVNIGEFAKALTPVAEDLHILLEKRTIEQVDLADPEAISANLYTAVQRLDRILKHIDDVLGDPDVKSNLRQGIENLLAMSVDGRAAFADLRETSATLRTDVAQIADKTEMAIDNINARADQLADAAMPVLNESARTAANFRVLSDGVLQGQGTLGKLLTDDRLYETMVLSMERITDAVDSLRRLFYHFEQRGRIGINVGGPLGGMNVDRELPK